MQGECLDPSCDPGDFACEGATLLTCNMDRTAMVVDEECGSSTLCNETDGRCDDAVCDVDGSIECTADNALRRCVDGRSRWEIVTECPAGTTCSNDPSLQDPCLTECPDSPYQCVGNVRRVCSDATGVATWTVDRTCNTPALCQCALNGTCTAYTSDNKCGEPVCGANLDDFNCNDGWLQSCSTGRDQWVNQMDCGSDDLCNVDSTGDNGACLACPDAGEVQCYNDYTARRTCSNDQSEWINSQNCSYDCIDNGTNDYCAVCFEDELRCDNGGDLDVCAAGRGGLEDEQNCPFTCVNNGNSDFCALCEEDERRCNGARTLERCSDDLTELILDENCAYSCIDDGTDDFCGVCQDGAEQCNGNDLETCTGGVWGGGMECLVACIDEPGGDFCAPDCDPETFTATCDGDTLQTCNDEGELVETACAGVCALFGSTARCAECDPLDFENTCDDDSLVSCSTSGIITTTSCPNSMPECIEIGGEGECVDCDPASSPPVCDNDTLEECSSSGNVVTTDCSDDDQICTTISGVAACRDCVVGDTQCATSDSEQTCTAGSWGAPTDCPVNTRCVTNECVCQNGDTRCDDGDLLECTNGSWDVLETCEHGCTGSYPNAVCAADPTTSTVTVTVTSTVTTTGTGGGTSTTGTGGGTSTTGTAGTGGVGGMGGTGGVGGMGGMLGTGGMGGAAGGGAAGGGG